MPRQQHSARFAPVALPCCALALASITPAGGSDAAAIAELKAQIAVL